MLPAAAAAHYRQQQRLVVAALGLARQVWKDMGPEFDRSWNSIGPRLTLIAFSAQLGAARAADPYLSDVLDELGIEAPPEGDLDPEAFTGVAGDGRALDSLLYGAVTAAKIAVSQGLSPRGALEQGGRWLDMAMHTVVVDTARAAVSVGITARPRVAGYVRMLNPPSCGRCAVLAGKWFKWNAGFARHPRCDCRHIPAAEDMAGDLRTDPGKAFRSGNVQGLSDTDRRAIEAGADISQVVNAHRGMSVTTIGGRSVQVTSEGTKGRGVAFGARARSRMLRLMPQTIYDVATDRSDAIRLLKIHGYLLT